jgi:hypothetical protein
MRKSASTAPATSNFFRPIAEQLEELGIEVLAVFGLNLDKSSNAYRNLGMAMLRKKVAALQAIQQRHQGGV